MRVALGHFEVPPGSGEVPPELQEIRKKVAGVALGWQVISRSATQENGFISIKNTIWWHLRQVFLIVRV